MRNVIAAGVGVVAGVWLMAAPAVLGYTGAPATMDRIVGPTAVAMAWIAAAEATRSMRWVNVVLGAATVFSAIVLDRSAMEALHAALSGLVLIGTALVMTRIRSERFGGGWKSLFDL